MNTKALRVVAEKLFYEVDSDEAVTNAYDQMKQAADRIDELENTLKQVKKLALLLKRRLEPKENG